MSFLTHDHGYVILASTGAFAVNMWLSFKVGGARKKYGVKYPDMYSDKEPTFNCIQRAHQNYLEVIPFFLTLLFTGSVRHPCGAGIAGGIFLVGRILYAIGYSTGNAEKRIPGALLGLVGGLLPLFGFSISSAGNLLGWF